MNVGARHAVPLRTRALKGEAWEFRRNDGVGQWARVYSNLAGGFETRPYNLG